ncbi:double-stranded RNA-specific editase Adar isoform X1 [Chironomus tepperi]|uniref:double-stranded RNA-specific editase Adar isoform X1 n=2 Tax=Chironomus tepperi TaxID=113505 RepID=UPI00391F2A66
MIQMKSENADKQHITMNKSDGGVESVSNGTTNSTAASGRKKRSAEQSIKTSSRKRRKGSTNNQQDPQPKNAVAILNELKKNLVYELESQEGPYHAPVFTMSVLVDGQKYIGQGKSKKLARIDAATCALRDFIQFKDQQIKNGVIGMMCGRVVQAANTNNALNNNYDYDFTSDDHIENTGILNSNNSNIKKDNDTVNSINNNQNHTLEDENLVKKIQQSLECFKKSKTENIAWVNRLQKITKSIVTANSQNKITTEKGPVMLLYELFTDITFNCTQTVGPQHAKFKTIVTVNGCQQFEGTGPSKKLSKNAAAKAALASLCNISFSPLNQKGILLPGSNVNGDSNDSLSNDGKGNNHNNVELPQTFADVIGRLVSTKYEELMIGNEVYARRKVLAGIVLTIGSDIKTAKVISVTTGTKCISGEYISEHGLAVNDSHAEIVARRCFMTFVYDQLELHVKPETAKDSVFEKPLDGNYLYRLKDNIQVHLYINTAPCGDARVFSPHENDQALDKHPNRKARGQLRTKVESGEGTIPVKNCDSIQCWDGILNGQRLLTMSCSDKIARWNVLGLQGALLSSIVQPIYLHSIVLGSLLHPNHMYRAIAGRLEKSIKGLPPPYRLNIPKLALVTSSEARCQLKPPNYSINWTIGQNQIEIINSFTGKTVCNKYSRLTKQNMFHRFSRIVSQLPNITNRSISKDYGDEKGLVYDYQQAKSELIAAFQREELGNWLKKPIEQDQFPLILNEK